MSYYYSNPGGFSISKTVMPSITSSICQSAGLNSGGVVRENATVSTSSTAVLPYMQETITTTTTTTQSIQKTFSTISGLSFKQGNLLFVNNIANTIFEPTYNPLQHTINDNLAQYLISCVIEPDIGLNVSLVVKKKDMLSDNFTINFIVNSSPIFTNPPPTIYMKIKIINPSNETIIHSHELTPTFNSQTITLDSSTTSTSTTPLHTSSFQQEVDNNPKLILLK